MTHLHGVDDGHGYGVKGESTNKKGVRGESIDDVGVGGYSTNRTGVLGLSTRGTGVAGYGGSKPGVLGYSGDAGVAGYSPSSHGVRGISGNAEYDPYYDRKVVGVFGKSETGVGVYGYSPNDIGVNGESTNYLGVAGYSSNNTGVQGVSGSGNSKGVAGYSSNYHGVSGWSYNHTGVYGTSFNGRGVDAESYNSTGVHGWSYNSTGVYAESYKGIGLIGLSLSEGIGVYASVLGTGEGYAAYLDGRVHIRGPLEKPGGSFKIDHPLDPANKYLCHSFVESPDMKNVYDGVVVLDDNGEADIELPDWFGILNKDFRYQLTAIGAPGPNLYIAEEISDTTTTTNYSSSNNNNSSRFKIAGGASGMKVSWQVTGIRRDPWANANRIQVEEDKSDKECGYYLHPDLYRQPEDKGISHLLFPKDKREELTRAAHK